MSPTAKNRKLAVITVRISQPLAARLRAAAAAEDESQSTLLRRMLREKFKPQSQSAQDARVERVS